jgi:alpha-beta hydrolase superfamily lysophospholipase
LSGTHVVRYAARGHGGSSPTTDPADCTWRALGRDMLQLGQLKRRDPEQKAGPHTPSRQPELA